MEISKIILRAESGDSTSQFELGLCYLHGNGIEPSPKILDVLFVLNSESKPVFIRKQPPYTKNNVKTADRWNRKARKSIKTASLFCV
jgi:TPR repeat protein